jgi:hypothetical protein
VNIFSDLSVNLDAKVQAALVTAIAALVASFVSILTSIFTTIYSGKSQRDLENFKFDLACQNKNIEEQKKALNDFIGSIQELKDILLMIIDDELESLDTQTAKEKLTIANERLLKCYQTHQTYLVETERPRIHDVKNESMRITKKTNVLFIDKRYMSELSAVEKSELRDFREKLGECQDLLRDSRSSL